MDKNYQAEAALPMERLLYEVKKVIVGQDHLLSAWWWRCWRAGTSW